MDLIIPFHKGKKAKEVTDFSEIHSMANDMQVALQNNTFTPYSKKTNLALHHSQVSEDPYNFFVIRREILGLPPTSKKLCVIVNPQIIEKDKESLQYRKEGCMSYPHNKEISLKRYGSVKVKYLTPAKGKKITLVEVAEWVEGIKAQIFQHECEHSNGITIYK